MVQTVPKTVWRFVVVQKTTEISQLPFIDKVLPYVVAQRQISMVLTGVYETVQKTVEVSHLQYSALMMSLLCRIIWVVQSLDKVVDRPVIVNDSGSASNFIFDNDSGM